MEARQIRTYIRELDRQFGTDNATEHSYRPMLTKFLEAATPGVRVINEPKQIACGAPDLVLTRSGIPLGYIEAKDLGSNLDNPVHKEQLQRYSGSLDNLVFTNYTEFRLFREGRQVMAAGIAEVTRNKVKPTPANFTDFEHLYRSFIGYEGRTLTSAAELAEQMARKARLLANVIKSAPERDGDTFLAVQDANNELRNQLDALREHLIHDIELAEFADIYAQTVAYGMFAARLHDPTPANFSRQEAAELIPVSNPFLRKFFQHIAGYDLDTRIRWIVDDLVAVFRAADVGELMKDYGEATQQNDPFIHFYETFLAAYDPKLRKSRGVWYTPKPVVDFIVRAVDDILQSEFGLLQGLADTSKTTIEIDSAKGKKERIEKKVHKVQILDPAAGTGTFLATIVQHIHQERFANQEGRWPNYVREHLIPRLNGFELLMAPYAMAHIKLEMTLRQTGCEFQERLRIFLCNALDEYHPGPRSLQFTEWLSTESNEANAVKRDTPVMVVIGNPPYSGESANKGEWILERLQDYKQEPGGGKLQEKNSKWINDDYVKFIRYGQYHVDRTDQGVLAYINNHSFLDNPTFRGMRWSLLQSFDTIYIIDLHGNSKKKETAPDGSVDKNVFDIQQGVSINLFVKTGRKKAGALGRVFHYDVYGERESKYQFLWDNNLERIDFTELKPQAPQYYFVPRNYKFQAEYEQGFSATEMFPVNGVGICSKRDRIAFQNEKEDLLHVLNDFCGLSEEELKEKYGITKESRDQKISYAKSNIESYGVKQNYVRRIDYRPFDTKYTYYTDKVRGFLAYPVYRIMSHFLHGENIGLITNREQKIGYFDSLFVSKTIIDLHIVDNGSYFFPLYLYPDTKQPPQQTGNTQTQPQPRHRKIHCRQTRPSFYR